GARAYGAPAAGRGAGPPARGGVPAPPHPWRSASARLRPRPAGGGPRDAGEGAGAVEEADGLRGRLAWGAAYVVVTGLAFPFEFGGRVFDFGWLFAWWPPALLLLAVRGLAPRRAAGLGLLLGTFAHGLVWHWIWVVTVRYGHAPGWVGVAAPLLLATHPGICIAGFAAASAALTGPARKLGPFGLAALWEGVEHGRALFLTGFSGAAHR